MPAMLCCRYPMVRTSALPQLIRGILILELKITEKCCTLISYAWLPSKLLCSCQDGIAFLCIILLLVYATPCMSAVSPISLSLSSFIKDNERKICDHISLYQLWSLNYIIIIFEINIIIRLTWQYSLNLHPGMWSISLIFDNSLLYVMIK